MKKLILAAFLAFAPLYAHAENLPKIRVGYMPNLWFAQVFVIKNQGWDKQAGFELEPHRYPGPPVQAQAFASNEIDVGYNNVASVLPLASRDIPFRVVAGTLKQDIFLASRGTLNQYRNSLSPEKAIEAFVAHEGRPVRISTNPKGTLSDMVLRYWLDQKWGDHAKDYVTVINTGSQDQFQQSILSGDVDAASVFQPLYTIAHAKLPDLMIFASPDDMMADQPGGVVLVHQEFVDQHADLVQKLVSLNHRATAWLRTHPEKAADDVHAFIGAGNIDPALTRESVVFTKDRFTDNPHDMIAATRVIHDLMIRKGYMNNPVNVEGLFDTRFYDKISRE